MGQASSSAARSLEAEVFRAAAVGELTVESLRSYVEKGGATTKTNSAGEHILSMLVTKAPDNAHTMTLVRACVEQHRAQLERKVHGYTMLHLAAMHGRLEATRYFAERIDVDKEVFGDTAARYASAAGHAHVLRFLIFEKGAKAPAQRPKLPRMSPKLLVAETADIKEALELATGNTTGTVTFPDRSRPDGAHLKLSPKGIRVKVICSTLQGLVRKTNFKFLWDRDMQIDYSERFVTVARQDTQDKANSYVIEIPLTSPREMYMTLCNMIGRLFPSYVAKIAAQRFMNRIANANEHEDLAPDRRDLQANMEKILRDLKSEMKVAEARLVIHHEEKRSAKDTGAARERLAFLRGEVSSVFVLHQSCREAAGGGAAARELRDLELPAELKVIPAVSKSVFAPAAVALAVPAAPAAPREHKDQSVDVGARGGEFNPFANPAVYDIGAEYGDAGHRNSELSHLQVHDGRQNPDAPPLPGGLIAPRRSWGGSSASAPAAPAGAHTENPESSDDEHGRRGSGGHLAVVLGSPSVSSHSRSGGGGRNASRRRSNASRESDEQEAALAEELERYYSTVAATSRKDNSRSSPARPREASRSRGVSPLANSEQDRLSAFRPHSDGNRRISSRSRSPSRSPSPRVVEDEDEDEEEDEGDLCTVCMEQRPDSLLLPCKHLCICASCADEEFKDADDRAYGQCPICRGKIAEILQIYRS